MSDGRQSPVFGTRNVIDAELKLDISKDIGSVEILSSTDEKYVHSIRFFERSSMKLGMASAKGPLIGEIVGAETEGLTRVFELEPGWQILGMHGSLNSAPNIRALNFIVWNAAD